jgi:type IV pilus assembly protein PilO
MQKYLDKLNKVPITYKVGGLFVILVLIVASFYFQSWSEISAKVTALESEKASLQRQFEDRQRVADDLATFQENTRRLEEDLQNALLQLPREKEVPQLLRDIYTLGNQSGILFRTFEPGSPQAKSLYSELPLRLQITGGYHEIAVFFDRVGKMSRIVNISNVEMTGGGSNKTASGREELQVNVTATTFMFTGGGQK